MDEHIDPLIIGDDLRTREAHLHIWSEVVDGLNEGIVVTGLDGTILDCNPAFERITGYSRAEVLGLNPRILKSGRHDAVFYAALWDALVTRGSWVGELWNRRKDGEIYPERLALRAVRGADGLPSHYVGMFSDISREKQDQARLDYLTHHDALTGFANRKLFMERLEQAIERADAGEGKAAVLLLDLDRFRRVNESLGQGAGDRLLQVLANLGADQRMQQAFQPAAFLGVTENSCAQGCAIELAVVLQNLITEAINNGL